MAIAAFSLNPGHCGRPQIHLFSGASRAKTASSNCVEILLSGNLFLRSWDESGNVRAFGFCAPTRARSPCLTNWQRKMATACRRFPHPRMSYKKYRSTDHHQHPQQPKTAASFTSDIEGDKAALRMNGDHLAHSPMFHGWLIAGSVPVSI
jgi:hypothetical protein